MTSFAYLRISSKDQTNEQEMTQINAAGFSVDKDRIFIEHGVSGKVPALQREKFHR